MFQSSAIAKTTACGLLAAFSFVPLGRQTCTGPNCPGGQCATRATVHVNAVPVFAAPQLFNAGLGDRWVLVEEPVAEDGEELESPLKAEIEAEAEEADAQEESATEETQEPAAESNPKAAANVESRDAAKTQASGKTRQVWMRAADAAAAGLTPTTTATGGSSYGSSGSGVAMAAPVACQQVSYQHSWGCTGSGVQVFYGSAYQQSAPVYRVRRVLFPNLFPRLRGLR